MKFTLSLLLLPLILVGCSNSNSSSSSSKFSTSQPIKIREMNQRHVIYLQGVEQEKKGNHAGAVKYYRKAALQGHFMAKNDLGVKYYTGKGVPQDYKKAFYWINQVVEQAPDPTSNFNLANMYRQGLGVQKNYQKAINNYRIAEKMGNVEATTALGLMYSKGLGVKANKQLARDYYIEAATKGNSFAINNLGALAVETGDFKQARQWYEKAVAMGNKVAIKNLAKLNAKGR